VITARLDTGRDREAAVQASRPELVFMPEAVEKRVM